MSADTATRRTSALHLLARNPRFARVALAQAINSFGSSMAPVALAFAALDRGSGLGGLAMILTATALGPAIMTIIGGVAADHGNRARLIFGSRIISGLLQTTTAVLVLSGLSSPWALAILSFAMSSLSSYTIPAARAMVRDLVDGEDLQRGTAVMSLCIDTARLLGPGLAGILLAVIPNGAVLLIDAGTFFVSAALILKIRLDPLPARKATALEQLLGGLRYSMGHRWLWVTAVCGLFINGAWMAGYQLLGPTLAHTDYGGPAFWGLCGTAYTAGLLLGGVLALKIQAQQPIVACVFASTGVALPLAALGLHLPGILVIILLAIASALLALAMTWWSSGIPALVDREHLARTFAFNSAIELGGVPLAYAAVGTTTSIAHVQASTFELIAVAVILIASIFNVIALHSFAKPRVVPENHHD